MPCHQETAGNKHIHDSDSSPGDHDLISPSTQHKPKKPKLSSCAKDYDNKQKPNNDPPDDDCLGSSSKAVPYKPDDNVNNGKGKQPKEQHQPDEKEPELNRDVEMKDDEDLDTKENKDVNMKDSNDPPKRLNSPSPILLNDSDDDSTSNPKLGGYLPSIIPIADSGAELDTNQLGLLAVDLNMDCNQFLGELWAWC
ncbi:hypothetical protein L228DRAFT_266287 [Xylona heveae TC161]|uniref:Uncharacterized protein n=1 Tax=Xylona heveae (strain CBS 132557 / TC161) TaxID=1328760 RepID=A0A165J7I5_XYLHT|nr:hypothetical protein L228DRAFT_266287 [Xylona heveae TC161]KZF25849.1 hypothetical protein L228DRAFT_266287 [Xylona heveae TC161]